MFRIKFSFMIVFFSIFYFFYLVTFCYNSGIYAYKNNLLSIIYYVYSKRTISVKNFVLSTTMKKILEIRNIYFLY